MAEIDDTIRALLPPPANPVNDAAKAAAKFVLPNIADHDFWGELPPPSMQATPEGKLPSTDPRIAGALSDAANVATNFMGGPELGAAKLGGAAAKAIFAGPMALTADKKMLSKAMDMSGHAHPGDIWKETGWFRDVDGQMKFEIPDDNLSTKLKDNFLIGRGNEKKGNLSDVLSHPELFEAYPGLKDYRGLLKRGPQAGSAGGDRMFVQGGHKRERDSVAAHELNHLVADIQDFAPGESYSRILKLAQTHPQWGELTDQQYNTVVDKLHQIYSSTLGEVSSRNVQTRLKLDPESRRNLHPFLTSDTSVTKQMVPNDWLGRQPPEIQSYVLALTGHK